MTTGTGAQADWWTLSANKPLRLFTLFLFYVGQGVPIGLFWFAIPAWMATNGASAEDVTYVLGFTTLPWSLKLVNGFLMDRYTFFPMGRRRIWLIGAQIVMIAIFLICALVRPEVDDVMFLAAAGFAANVATTFQDVAVDGLAVDIMEADEQATGSGMMFGGQAIGISASTALSGAAIAYYGSAAAYLLSCLFIGMITIFAITMREREGERRLPWTQGVAHPRNLALRVEAWWPILKATFRSIIKTLSLVWVPLLLVRGLFYGICTGVTPLVGANTVGWDEAQITGVVGSANFVAGIAGLLIGWLAWDRLGAQRSTALMFAMIASVMLLMIWQEPNWSDPDIYRTWIFAWVLGDTLITVAALPISMRLCDPRVAATQFTIYMACANMGISLGAWMLGLADELGGYSGLLLVIVATMTVGLVVMLTIRFPEKSPTLEEVAEDLPTDGGLQPARD